MTQNQRRRARTGRTATTALLTAATAVVLTACSVVVPSGETVTEAREVDDFTGVVLEVAGTLNISHGDRTELSLTGDRSLVRRITTEVHDGVLEIGLPRRTVGATTVQADLVLPNLDLLRVDGAGKVRANLSAGERLEVDIDGLGDVRIVGVDVEELVAQIDGAGQIDVTGRAGHQEVTVNGAGRFLGGELASDTARVTISGAGSADVDVTTTLDATISGAGEITYTGDADVTRQVDGVGQVVRR